MSGVLQGEVCDICGDVGVIEAISKCFKCKINQQHFYCGKTYPQNMSGEWYCDDCEKETTASPKHVNRDILAASKSGKHRREEKMATKGKVKCIPCEEVIKLSSGSKKGESPIKKAIQNSKFLPQTITGAVRPGVEVKVAIPGKDRYKASETSNTQKQFPELISSAAVRPAVEVNVATLRKSISKAGEASSTLSPKKPSHQLINSVTEPSVETKVGSVGKEVYKASEASNALSPEKRSQQPIGSAAVRPAVEINVSTPRKSISKASEASRTLSPEKASHQLINSEPSVETKVGTVGKELYKASEASNALLPKKQFPELISSAAVRPAVEVNVATQWKSIPALSTLSPEKPSHQLINSEPSVETKVGSIGKESYKASEASNSLPPEKRSRQPIGSAAVRPAVEVNVATLQKSISKAGEASSTLSPEKPSHQPINSAAVRPAVEVNVATPWKSISKAGEASSTLSPEKPSHQLINSVAKPSVETKVGSVGKEFYKASESSNSLSPEKESQQPISSGVNDATMVKVTSTPYDGLCGQFSEKQLSPLTSPVKPSGSTWEVIHKASEALNALSPKKQFPPPQPISSFLSAVETKTGKQIIVSIESSCAQGSTSGHQVSGDLDPIASDVGNFEAMNVEPKGPSLVYSWRGRFKISGETFKNINSWFKAHPRFRVIRNVVDILLHMPELLQFKLIYRRDVWIELFQDDCPDEDDIGLYLFPENKRSSSDYDFLRLFIEENDYAMKYDLNGVELFLFTSKVLVADSQKLKGDYFIWGVFRPIKKEKYVSKLYEELPLVVHRPSDSAQTSNFSNNNDDDNDCSVDMEIDMVAGNDVGRVDVAVPSDLSSGAFPLQEIKKEEGLGCPPGFEEIFRLKKLVQ